MVACASLLVLCLGCSEEKVEARAVVRPVKTFTFGEGGKQISLRYPGRVHANRTVELAFEVTGKLEELPVSRGQQVEKGQLLARLDQRDFKASLEQAEAKLAEAKATHERFSKAFEKRAVARQQVDEALAQLQVAQAEVKVRTKALSDTELRADFDGVVADRYYDNFQNVVAKEAVFSIQDISKLEIRINIPESDMTRAADSTNAGRVVARFAAVSDREFDLELKEFATDADAVTQTFLVTLMMPMPEDVEVLPGMTAQVIWEPGGAVGNLEPTVPVVAVGGMPEGQSWVWVIDPATGKVQRRDVRLGKLVEEGLVEIVSGLNKGETIAAAGVYLLDEGMQVKALGTGS